MLYICSMNYEKIYNQLIIRAKNRVLEGYSERHHIIPRCMGGSYKKENLVRLTAREHYICHWLLTRMYPTNSALAYSFWMMNTSKIPERYKGSSRTYQEAKEKISSFLKGKKRVFTEQWKANISKGQKGRPGVFKGKKLSEEHKKNLSLAKKKNPSSGFSGKTHSEETKVKWSEKRRGRPSPKKGKTYKKKQNEQEI